MNLVEARDLRKIYRMGKIGVQALRGIDLDIQRGEFLSIMGPSGCGKTTLLNLLGGLDRPTSGVVMLDGVSIAQASQREIVEIHRRKVGFVFQMFHLIPTMTAFENVTLPLQYARVERGKRRLLAEKAMTEVGLSDRMHHRPTELSGGEQQRVAIARAIVHNPLIVFADEPTGELDSATAQLIVNLMRKLNVELGQTFVLVTHDRAIAETTERIVSLEDGIVVGDMHRDRAVKSELVNGSSSSTSKRSSTPSGRP